MLEIKTSFDNLREKILSKNIDCEEKIDFLKSIIAILQSDINTLEPENSCEEKTEKQEVKCRKITDLTDEEIIFIINDLCSPVSIKNIERRKDIDEVTADIVTDGWSDGKRDSFEIEDEIVLAMPGFSVAYDGIDIPIPLDYKDIKKYHQFLLAKGCHYLLEDNPYINEDDENKKKEPAKWEKMLEKF